MIKKSILSSMFSITTVSGVSVTLGGGQVLGQNIGLSRSGYTAIAVLGWDFANVYILPQEYYMSSSGAMHIQYYNRATTTQTFTPRIRVLWLQK